MKYYVVDEKPDTIYAGEISKADPDKKVYEHAIKSYYVVDQSGKMNEYPNPDSHIDLYVTKAYNTGLIKEFPSLESAKDYLVK